MNINSKLPENPNQKIDYSNTPLAEIYFAGGCFWGVQAYIRRVLGVAHTSVGYANGSTVNPTYSEVCNGNTGYAETVHVKYDPARISLEGLLDKFFGIIDPTSFNRQGNDYGSQYRSGVYFTNPDDKEIIVKYVNEKIVPEHNRKIVTEIKPLEIYYKAEDYHQEYLEKNPNGYCHIKF